MLTVEQVQEIRERIAAPKYEGVLWAEAVSLCDTIVVLRAKLREAHEAVRQAKVQRPTVEIDDELSLDIPGWCGLCKSIWFETPECHARVNGKLCIADPKWIEDSQ